MPIRKEHVDGLYSDLAETLDLDGKCICGIFSLDVLGRGGKIQEVPVRLNEIDKPRGIAWYHENRSFTSCRRSSELPSRYGRTTPDSHETTKVARLFKLSIRVTQRSEVTEYSWGESLRWTAKTVGEEQCSSESSSPHSKRFIAAL